MVVKKEIEETVSSPAKKKKIDPEKLQAKLSIKYHFCFSALPLNKNGRAYKMVAQVLKKSGDIGDIRDKQLLPNHFMALSLDDEDIIHIDFIGEDWTDEETDRIYAVVRDAFRSKQICFAFSNYLEKKSRKLTNDGLNDGLK